MIIKNLKISPSQLVIFASTENDSIVASLINGNIYKVQEEWVPYINSPNSFVDIPLDLFFAPLNQKDINDVIQFFKSNLEIKKLNTSSADLCLIINEILKESNNTHSNISLLCKKINLNFPNLKVKLPENIITKEKIIISSIIEVPLQEMMF